MVKKSLVSCLVLVSCVLAIVNVSFAADKAPDATISVSQKTVALGVGVSWGDGNVQFQGKEQKISINGLSVVDLGVSSLDAAGEIYNLTKIEDLAGTYSAVKGDITVGGGVGGIRMKNQNGVVIRMSSKSVGAKLALGPEGLKIKLKS